MVALQIFRLDAERRHIYSEFHQLMLCRILHGNNKYEIYMYMHMYAIGSNWVRSTVTIIIHCLLKRENSGRVPIRILMQLD